MTLRMAVFGAMVALISCTVTYVVAVKPYFRHYVRRLQFMHKMRRWHGADLPIVSNAWYSCDIPILWAYAGGGALHNYGNSVEAIDESIKRGYRVIELDVSLTSDGVPVLTHWFKPDNQIEWDDIPSLSDFKNMPINGQFHSLTLRELFERYEKADVFFSIDPNHMIAKKMAFDLLGYIKSCASVEFQKKIIYQVYRSEDLLKVKAASLPFASIHYVVQFGEDEFWKIPYLIRQLTECGVRSVSFADRPLSDSFRNAVALFNKAGIVVSVSGVDYVPRAEKLMGIGVKCFNTRRMEPYMFTHLGSK